VSGHWQMAYLDSRNLRRIETVGSMRALGAILKPDGYG
jgi:hypothetical protein